MDFAFGEALPDAEVFEDGLGGMGEGDFAAIKRRIGDDVRLVRLNNADVELAACECTAEGESCRTSADDDDIGLFLHGFLRGKG